VCACMYENLTPRALMKFLGLIPSEYPVKADRYVQSAQRLRTSFPASQHYRLSHAQRLNSRFVHSLPLCQATQS
jgi:hypothetical protein